MLAAIIQGIGQGGMLALVAVGLVLVYKGSGVLNLAQGEIGAVAVFLSYAIFGKQNANGIVLMLGAVVIAAGMGVATERFIMRPLVERPPLQGTIATLGLTIVLIQLTVLNGREGFLGFLPEGQRGYPVTNIPKVISDSRITLFEGSANQFQVEWERVVALVLTLVAGAALATFFTKTKFGRGVVAATADNTVARLLGIPVKRVYLFTWAVGGALSGLGAVLYSSITQFNPGTMTIFLLSALVAAVIGGLDSIPGAIVGGLLVGVIRGVIEYQFDSGIADLAMLALVVVTLLVRPRGILGGINAAS